MTAIAERREVGLGPLCVLLGAEQSLLLKPVHLRKQLWRAGGSLIIVGLTHKNGGLLFLEQGHELAAAILGAEIVARDDHHRGEAALDALLEVYERFEVVDVEKDFDEGCH